MKKNSFKKAMFFMNIIFLLTLAECVPERKECLENGSTCTNRNACCSKLCQSRVYPIPIKRCIPNSLVVNKSPISIETEDRKKKDDMCITNGNHCTQQSQCCSKYCVVVGLMNQLCMSKYDPNEPEVGNSPYSLTPRSQKPKVKCRSTGYFCSAHNECCSQQCVSIGYHSIKACFNSTMIVDTPVKNSFNSTITILNSTLDYCTPNNHDCHDFSRCCVKICAPIGFTGIDLCIYLPKNKTWTIDPPSSSSVTTKSNQNSDYCALNGHYCVEDNDCCSEKCYSILNTKLHACIDP